MTKFKLGIADQEAEEFEVTRQGNQISVTHNGETAVFTLTYQNSNQLVVEREFTDGGRRQMRLAGHIEGDNRQLWVNAPYFSKGASCLLTYQRIRERAAADVGDGSLSASIPAIVADLLVSEGDVVAVGDKLILLESMKMIIPIQAPYDGEVTAINCAIGDSVQAGVPLIELNDFHASDTVN